MFETPPATDVESVGVPGFFTYAGFQKRFIDQLPTIAEQVQRDHWVLGDAGEQAAVTAQFDNLTRDLLDLYGHDFHRRLAQALEQAADATAHRRQAEIRRAGCRRGSDLADPAADRIDPRRDRPDARTQGRQGFRQGRFQGRRKDAQEGTCAVTGRRTNRRAGRQHRGGVQAVSPGRRRRRFAPPDRHDHRRSGRDQQHASDRRDEFVAGTAGHRRDPQPGRAIQDRRGAHARAVQHHAAAIRQRVRKHHRDDTYRQIRDEFQKSVYGPCQRSRIEPLSDGPRRQGRNRAGGFRPAVRRQRLFRRLLQEIPGYIRRHVAARMEMASGQSGRQVDLGRNLAAVSARGADPRRVLPDQRQRAPDQPEHHAASARRGRAHREAGNQRPSGGLFQSAKPGSGRGAMAGRSRQDGRIARSRRRRSVAGAQPSEISGGTGQWAFFRLLDKASKTPRANSITASWIVGGREVPFQIGTGTVFNPLQLPALAEFKCPPSL